MSDKIKFTVELNVTIPARKAGAKQEQTKWVSAVNWDHYPDYFDSLDGDDLLLDKISDVIWHMGKSAIRSLSSSLEKWEQ